MSDTSVLPAAPPAPPANAQEARTRLDALIADNDRGAKLLAGDAATTKEFNSLTAMVAEGGDNIDRAMTGALPDVPDSDLKAMAGTADMLREIGVSPDVIRQTLENYEITQAEFDATKAWQARTMKDQFFVKAWLEGDPDAARQMMLASIILSSNIKAKSGSF
jgi:hypothetical protein